MVNIDRYMTALVTSVFLIVLMYDAWLQSWVDTWQMGFNTKNDVICLLVEKWKGLCQFFFTLHCVSTGKGQ